MKKTRCMFKTNKKQKRLMTKFIGITRNSEIKNRKRNSGRIREGVGMTL